MSQLISLLPRAPESVTRRISASSQTSRPPTFALYTLGCKVNQSDSHQIARMLQGAGFRRVEFREVADLYVIDTCTVTAEADRKSRKAAARAARNNPAAVVAVTGCAATNSAEQFFRVVPEALVLNNAQKFELPERALEKLQSRELWAQTYELFRAQHASEPMPSATRERVVLKIQDGCNHRCAFCIIPSVRGASVTKSRAQISDEAQMFVSEGAREIVVTGVSMGDFGRRKAESGRRNGELCDLLRELSGIEGLERIRVSSLDPADVDEEWLQTVATTPKVCPHLHFALQAGGAQTLRRMRRRYTPELFLKWANRWREIRPDGGLTTDLIVGFPGESNEDFQESLQVAKAAKFSAIHVFPYSVRPGTAAANFPDLQTLLVAPAVQKQRVDELLKLARELSAQFAAQFFGQTLQILVEELDGNSAAGLTPHYLKARVLLPANFVVQAGDLLNFRAEVWRDDALEGAAIL